VIRIRDLCIGLLLLCGLSVSVVPAQAAAFKVLHTFTDGSDGALPYGLIADRVGNLYGTTMWGGCTTDPPPLECGTVFRVATDGTESILHTFCPEAPCTDGQSPSSGLIADKAGNLYGMTWSGGASNAGTVYRLSPGGTESVLYSFTGGNDGSGPGGNLIRDKAGNIYGTTFGGGANGAGVIFKLTKSGTESVLYAFTGGSDGDEPMGIIADGADNLYGTTEYGGDPTNCPGADHVPAGCGVVFKLTPDGMETVLHAFTGESDGATPNGGVVADAAGNLYGTTEVGGGTGCADFGPGCGTVFKIATDGSESVLYAFKAGRDGAYPRASVIVDETGDVYGTTYSGGDSVKRGCSSYGGCGIVFKVAPDGIETVLHSFNVVSASGPSAPVMLRKGTLYGTTGFGGGTGCLGTGCGTVFSLKE
jgi:uncharacterized repeat protein (TIGR03803 family)